MYCVNMIKSAFFIDLYYFGGQSFQFNNLIGLQKGGYTSDKYDGSPHSLVDEYVHPCHMLAKRK